MSVEDREGSAQRSANELEALEELARSHFDPAFFGEPVAVSAPCHAWRPPEPMKELHFARWGILDLEAGRRNRKNADLLFSAKNVGFCEREEQSASRGVRDECGKQRDGPAVVGKSDFVVNARKRTNRGGRLRRRGWR